MTTSPLTPMSGDYQDIRLLSPDSGEWRTLIAGGGYDPRYVQSGHLIYARAGLLHAAPFDLDTVEIIGEAVPILDDVRLDSVFAYAQVAFSDDGTLVYLPGGESGVGIPTWIDREGRSEVLDMPSQVYGMFNISPQDDRLAIHVGGLTDQVWVYDLANLLGTRLTTEGNNGWPLWSPDGTEVMYVTREGEQWSLNVRSADGTGEPQTLYSHTGRIAPSSWSAENNAVFLLVGDGEGDVVVLSLEDRSAPVALSYPRRGQEWGHSFSPDGRWVGYASSRDGPFEVFVSPYPELETQVKVSDGGGAEPLWSADGSQLIFRVGNQWKTSRVSTESGFSATAPSDLFQTPFVDTLAVSWDLSSDGRFMVIEPTVEPSNPTQLRVIENWSEELERLVPSD